MLNKEYNYTNASPLVESLTRPNGSVTTYYYDDTMVNRLITISNKNSGSTVINQFSYVYSNDLRSSETVTNGSSITFSNDVEVYDYNNVNQLLTSTNTNSNKTFTHDDDGNMTQGYTIDGYVFSASYDAVNRLTVLEYTDTASSIDRKTEYSYSGDSFLAIMKKYDDGTLVNETRFVRHGLLPLQERDGNNTVTNEYTWGLNLGGGIGGLLNLKQSGQNYSYLYDGKGNVTALIDSSETVAVTYTYDTFGHWKVKTGSLDQPFQFSTKRFDSNTTLYYYGYRFYSPVLGRWITRDPIGEAGGINLYGFTGNNPVNWVDPFGLKLWYADTASEVAMKPHIKLIMTSPKGRRLLKQLHDDPTIFYIHVGSGPRGPAYKLGNDLYVDPSFNPNIDTDCGSQPASTTRILAHELGHFTGIGDDNVPTGIKMKNVIIWENPIMFPIEGYNRTRY